MKFVGWDWACVHTINIFFQQGHDVGLWWCFTTPCHSLRISQDFFPNKVRTRPAAHVPLAYWTHHAHFPGACAFSTQHHSNMASTQDDPVVIVGGGLAGALMAVYLAKRGFKVETYERRPDMRKETISAGRSINLALSVRGTTALAQAGISEDILGISIPMRGRMVHPLGGAVNFQPYSPDYEKVSLYSVSRGMLNMKLIDIAEKTAGINYHFDSKCAGVDFAKKEVSTLCSKCYLSIQCIHNCIFPFL